MTEDSRPKLMDIFEQMTDFYGPLSWWPAESAFEVCIGAILTQNTAWCNVEKAITELKNAEVLDPVMLNRISHVELAEMIRSSGFFNIKSKRIKAFVELLVSRYNGSLELMFAGRWQDLRAELLQVNGVGPETCDAILLYAGHKPSFVVDNYTRRLFQRLGMIGGNESYEEIRSLFMRNLAESVPVFNEYHALIVEHCKRFCRKKPLCSNCPLVVSCVHGQVDQKSK